MKEHAYIAVFKVLASAMSIEQKYLSCDILVAFLSDICIEFVADHVKIMQNIA